MNENDPKKDPRPVYVSPCAIRLDDLSTGIGACGQGGSPTVGDCFPTGNGATTGGKGCARGNGAKPYCSFGSGVTG